MATTPPGWYDDGHGALRWWDGAQWTEHVATPNPVAEGETAPTEADIVAAHEAAEIDVATALGVGVPPAAGAPVTPPASADHPQGAHPGGYPGSDAAAGAFVAATEPRTSKLWILWVVLGVVMLGIVIAAAIVIPLLFLNLATSGGSSGTPAAVSPSGADEEAAVAAVQLYDDAWQDVDCDAYVASTSEGLRELSGLQECADFQETASSFAASFEDYVVTVTDIESVGDTIVVSTTETYDALFDDDDEPLATPEPQEVEYEYSVIEVDGEWVIDDLTE